MHLQANRFKYLQHRSWEIEYRRENRDRTNQHNTAAQQASRACVLRLCIIQVIALWLIAYSSRIMPFVFALPLAFRLQRTTPTLVLI